MHDDDLPRSSGAPRAARAMTALLPRRGRPARAASTAFFVAAEFALVRSRRSRARGAGRARARAARARALHAAGRPQPVPLGLPVRHHAGLAGHRLPRRAGDRRARRAAVRRRSRTASPSAISVAHRLRDRHRRCTSPSASRSRRSTRSSTPSRSRCAIARPLHLFSAAMRPFITRAQRGVERRSCGCSASTRTPSRGGRHARGAARADRAGAHRRQARPGRGRDAHRASSTCTSRRRAR